MNSRKGTISQDMEANDHASFTTDAHFRIVTWDSDAERLFGYPRAEMVGAPLVRLLPGDDIGEKMRGFLQGEGNTSRYEFESWCRRFDGDLFWAELIMVVHTTKDGAAGKASVIVHDLTERSRVEQQLREREVQLRSLAARVHAVREEERTRIARELHDEFGQMLTALRMDITVLERMVSRTVSDPLVRAALIEKLLSTSELLEKTIRSTRRIITELRPAVLDELGVLAAIQWLAQDFENRTSVHCRIARLQNDVVLDRNTSTSIFRILQEALTNVARHASASNVSISLGVNGSELVLEISDDGKGMDEDKQKDPASTGILGIRERVVNLNGTFSIHSRPGEGATLTIAIPYLQDGGVAM